MRALLLSIALLTTSASDFAQNTVVDTHVHLHKGSASLAEYRAQLKAAGQSVDAFGAMWFGGPNKALAGNPAYLIKRNHSLIALAAKKPNMLEYATAHLFDVDHESSETIRVAADQANVVPD